MVRKGNLAVFESSNISETGSGTPTKIGVHILDINPYLHEFLSRFRSIKFFDDHGLYIVHGQKGKFGRFKSSNISETGEVMPPKIGVHVLDINRYLHEFFEPIPINQIF